MELIFKGMFGSHLYGLNTPDSDKDYKGIYIPSTKEIILGSSKDVIRHSTGVEHAKNTADDVDDTLFTLQYFIKSAVQGQTFAIDMLHTPSELTFDSSNVWQYLVKNRIKFYSKNMNAFMGYVKKQAAKYGIKGSKVKALEDVIRILENYKGTDLLVRDIAHELPETEYTYWDTMKIASDMQHTFYVVNGSKQHDVISVNELLERAQKQYDNYGHRAKQARNNEGVDWKAISHALRSGYQLKDIFQLGDFDYPLKQTQFLLDVKQGKLDYTTEVAPVLEELVEKLDMMSYASSLPDKVDSDFWNDYIYSVYTSFIFDELLYEEDDVDY